MKKLGQEPIVPTTWRQIGETEYRIATEKDLKEGAFLSSTNGMSKRFYAACAAMQGLLSGKYYNTLVNSPTEFVEDGFPEPISICKEAYMFADELLKQENE